MLDNEGEDKTSEKTEIKYQPCQHENTTDSGQNIIEQQDKRYLRVLK